MKTETDEFGRPKKWEFDPILFLMTVFQVVVGGFVVFSGAVTIVTIARLFMRK